MTAPTRYTGGMRQRVWEQQVARRRRLGMIEALVLALAVGALIVLTIYLASAWGEATAGMFDGGTTPSTVQP